MNIVYVSILGLVISFGGASLSYSRYVASVQNENASNLYAAMVDDVMGNKYNELLANCPNKKIIISELKSKQDNNVFLLENTRMMTASAKSVLFIQIWLWISMIILMLAIVTHGVRKKAR